jgi:hypothetical protein
MAQIIPLDNSPNQQFTATLNVDGSPLTLQFKIYYNEMAGYWMMDIADANGNPLLASRPLITGSWPAANLLQQFAYLKIGSAYIINASGSAMDYPDKTNLGTDFVLLWDDTATP